MSVTVLPVTVEFCVPSARSTPVAPRWLNESPLKVMSSPRETATAPGVTSGVVTGPEVFQSTAAWLSM